MKILVLGFLSMSAISTACQKNDSKNDGTSEFSVQFEAFNPGFSLPVKSTLKSATVEADPIVWNSVKLVISTIKFEAELKSQVTNKDSIEVEYKWHEPETINLLNDEIILGNFVLSPGTYDDIKLKVEGLKENAGTGPVFFLAGIYKNNTGN